MIRGTILRLAAVAIIVIVIGTGSAWAFSGGSGTEADPYVITDVDQLQEMRNDLAAYYVLDDDIDASDTQTWNASQGFVPVGTNESKFTGNFDGQMHIINSFYIDRGSDYGVGLFGVVGSSGVIENVGLTGNNINGRSAVGALVGANYGFVSNCYATGVVTGMIDVGGLVGDTYGIVTECWSDGSVTAGGTTGGFTSVGGLVGITRVPNAAVYNCYSTADVASTSAKYQTGGLIGINKDTVYKCFSTGTVTAASGSYSYGFCSLNQGSLTDCYWDIETSGKSSSYGGTGKTTAQMMQQATFDGWDFVDVWDIDEGQSYPYFVGSMTLDSIEIVGPGEVVDNSLVQYNAIAHYDTGGSKDVSDSVDCIWSVEPERLATAANGLLTIGPLYTHEEPMVIGAEYSEKGITVYTDVEVAVIADCTIDELVIRNILLAKEIKLQIQEDLAKALASELNATAFLDELYTLGDMSKHDVGRAKQKIRLAMQDEERAGANVDKSLDKLDDALNTLGIE